MKVCVIIVKIKLTFHVGPLICHVRGILLPANIYLELFLLLKKALGIISRQPPTSLSQVKQVEDINIVMYVIGLAN